MLRKLLRPEFDADAYLAVLRRLQRQSVSPLAGISVVDMLVRAGHEAEDWAGLRETAERIVASLTPEQRADPTQLSSPERHRIATACGLPSSQVDSFVTGFAQARRNAERFYRSGLLGRMRLAVEADPKLSRLKRWWDQRGSSRG